MGALHPAVRRPGRCLSDVEFGPLSKQEANAWLARRGERRRVDAATTLADLYGTGEESNHDLRPPHAFGFARALAQRPRALSEDGA